VRRVLFAQHVELCSERLRRFGCGKEGLLLLCCENARFEIGKLCFQLAYATFKLLQLDRVQALDV
jgi:hypothetical protein